MVSVVHSSYLDDDDDDGFDPVDRPRGAGCITSKGLAMFHATVCTAKNDTRTYHLVCGNGGTLCGDEVANMFPLMIADDVKCAECLRLKRELESGPSATDGA